jgi:hypothetical protein
VTFWLEALCFDGQSNLAPSARFLSAHLPVAPAVPLELRRRLLAVVLLQASVVHSVSSSVTALSWFRHDERAWLP